MYGAKRRKTRTGHGKNYVLARRRYRRKVNKIVDPFGRYRLRAYKNVRSGGFLGIELKFLDLAWNAVAINSSTDGSAGEVQPSTGCTNCLSVPAQGDGENERDGRKYTVKSIWVSGAIITATQSDQADVLQMRGWYAALVLDTQANGATIVSENVFVNPSTSALSVLPKPMRNLQYSKRYKILANQYIPPGGAYCGTDGASTVSVNMQQSPCLNLSWHGNLVCETKGTAANVTNATDNAIHLIMYAGSSTPASTLYAKARLRFMG